MNQNCEFTTERLSVKDWLHGNEEVAEKLRFAKRTIRILSPKVTEALPDGWQKINTLEKANRWIFERAEEGIFLAVYDQSNQELLGFLFLYECEGEKGLVDLRFGYLLAESAWGKGLGTELIHGLVRWCEEHGQINSLSGGVEQGNIASMKVMEKTGFSIARDSKASDDVVFYERRFQ
jgi:RimJ/RimL family protein N-acetyltransferase